MRREEREKKKESGKNERKERTEARKRDNGVVRIYERKREKKE